MLVDAPPAEVIGKCTFYTELTKPCLPHLLFPLGSYDLALICRYRITSYTLFHLNQFLCFVSISGSFDTKAH